jgi:hypothetical protein
MHQLLARSYSCICGAVVAAAAAAAGAGACMVDDVFFFL